MIWQSLDHRWEGIPPYEANSHGEMQRGNRAESSREIDVRKGLVYTEQKGKKISNQAVEGKPCTLDQTSGVYSPYHIPSCLIPHLAYRRNLRRWLGTRPERIRFAGVAPSGAG